MFRFRSKYISAMAGLLVLATAATALAIEKASCDPRGTVVVDGRPRLILGFYEYPKEDAKLKELADSGYNLIRVSDPKQLDRLEELGVYGWICTGVQLKEGDSAAAKRLADKIDAAKDRPALLTWELPDECLWNVWHRREGWMHGGERKALLAKIAASDAPEAKKAKWKATCDRASDLKSRGLYERSAAAYDSVWKALGEKNPRPNGRFATCEADSIALAERMRRGCDLVRERDPKHLIWQNHAPRNSVPSLRRFNEYVDAAGCDIYPAPLSFAGHSDLIDQTISSVGAFTRRMQAGAPGKSCWMVLQGFGWPDIHNYSPEKAATGRRPTWDETRFMAYDSLVNGADAILYWGTHSIEKDSRLWGDLMRIGKELAGLERLLVGEDAATPPKCVASETYGSIDPGDGPKLLLRHDGDDWILVAVNERNTPVPFTVSGLPKELEGKQLKRLSADETVDVKDGAFTDGIRSFGVHVYLTN